MFADLSDELRAQILRWLPGWAAARGEAVMQSWRSTLDEEWWVDRCRLEFAVVERSARVETWRQRYVQLLSASRSTTGRWSYCSSRHGLGDRVAQPRLFVGPSGKQLFNYGGWSGRGPQTDLAYVPLSVLQAAAVRGAADGEGNEDDAGASGSAGSDFQFSFAGCHGRPPQRAGVQTLTPLWRWQHGDRPSPGLVASVAEELSAAGALPEDFAVGSSLVMTFGGAQGGYNNENNSWSIGVLYEGEGASESNILWGQPKPKTRAAGDQGLPTARGAHSATYVPARFCPEGYPEGQVVIFGGHSHDCSQSLSSIETLNLDSWSWEQVWTDWLDVPCFLGSLAEDRESRRGRHGHTATFVEVDDRGYIIIVGGGEGNILSGADSDRSDAIVLDARTLEPLCILGLDLPPGVPPPGRHHEASPGLGSEILLFGGGRAPGAHVLVLDAAECVRHARNNETSLRVAVRELAPSTPAGETASRPRGRKMHAATCLLPWAPMFVTHGGWCTGPHFDDLWLFTLGRSDADLRDVPCGRQREARASFGAAGGGDGGGWQGAEVVDLAVRGANGQLRAMRVPVQVLEMLLSGGALQYVGTSEARSLPVFEAPTRPGGAEEGPGDG
eukprot:CAMPEP_0203908540 /NCGR_PEP_ID=MMETSP0359-20131031/49911_1 /ASSEMBLY_ACC=CAM_ASM_000338 /TAXON_ID=268821 /ORGANISM="Scrippsiella Hangoei, Strain SHTV-5" /LENGTH=613 /DNA_ID=CAMNT_0050833569 /DNA_START=35 /DNA_END=1873 /DNA_ORIENTATION=-